VRARAFTRSRTIQRIKHEELSKVKNLLFNLTSADIIGIILFIKK